VFFGTPQYMAPERVMSGEAGPSVDLYALGVIFFEMVTARLPFEANDPPTFLVKHMKETPPAPRSLNPRVHERVEALVLQLLEKDPRTRPVDAHQVEQELVALARAIGARVPPDAESDPESSTRPPARSLPSAVTEQWRRRVEVFEQMAARAYGPRLPSDQDTTLAELRKLVHEIDEVRAASAQEQRVLEEIDARGREGRQRLGFAVDALGLDASNAKEDARARRTQLAELARASAAIAEAYRGAQEELLAWEGRSAQSEPYTQLAQAHRACADVIDRWLVTRGREREALAGAESRDRAIQDLEYQIAQLRAALANHEAGIDRDRGAAQRRVVDLNARAERIERRLVQLATAFCAPLRARPDLGPLFQSLEASA
jgi:serine/threonine-protein kinase